MTVLCASLYVYAVQVIQWWYWWTQFTLLQVTRGIGFIWYPLYANLLVTLDVYMTVSKRTRSKRIRKICARSNKCIILPMAGNLCVFTDAFNVRAESLAFLAKPLPQRNHTCFIQLQKTWYSYRQKIGYFPPVDGWPMKMCMLLLAAVSVLYSVNIGIRRIYKAKKKQNKQKSQSPFKAYRSSQNSSAFMRSEIFDGDADTIIVDNSANCIIWRNKRHFEPSTYRKLNENNKMNIETASGDGNPVGIGDLNIGWYDDNGKYHSFILKDVFHIPTSPVNVLGLSAFSKSIGDYNSKGTRIDSSGQESIFTWDNRKFQRSFSHSDSNMPELSVNDGYAKYHRFCNFVEAIQPLAKQCYHVANKTKDLNMIHNIPYTIGEEIIYKNCDHVEKGVIEAIKSNPETKAPIFEIKFRGGRRIESKMDTLAALDDSDITNLPYTSEDFIEHARCLNKDELHQIQHPLPLTKLEREWKILHDKFGHIPYADMDKLVEHDIFPAKFKVLKGKPILCPSCMFGRMKRRAWRVKGVNNMKHIRRENENVPGAKVSMDQLVVAQPGLVPRLSGRHSRDRICGATGFLDHFTGYSFSSMQTSLDTDQTIAAKLNFETHAQTCGVAIKSYRADNGRFAEKAFKDEIFKAQQTIDYCAVGAHHQNGVIERHFQTLSTRTRTLLLHAKRYWPAMISVLLWPFAYKYAEHLHNHLHLDNNGLSPIQKFCKADINISLKDIHTWGCPCYVLDSKLQTGSMLAKWEPRSRLGVYLGHSPCHAGSVALVLNPRTLHVSPQFHVVFDDNFSTVPYLSSHDIPPNWKELVQKSEKTTQHDYDLAKLWAQSLDSPAQYLLNQEGDLPDIVEKEEKMKKVRFADDSANSEGVQNPDLMLEPTLPDINQMTQRRSSRASKPSWKAKQTSDKTVKRMLGMATVFTTDEKFDPNKALYSFVTHMQNINKLFDDTINVSHFYIFNVVAETNDVYTLSQMLKLGDIREFVLAMIKEIQEHESRGHWELVKRSALPKGSKTILSVWAFKRKRLPDGTILKHKARLNAHGGMQRWGVDYYETYAPVVNWISVRILMAISLIHNLDTKSIDFVLAFPQAELTRDVFMELPYGFEHGYKGEYVLKLKKNLYGLADASYNWFQKLTEGLESEGFKRSEIDQCVFLRADCVIMVYVDDMIALAKNKNVLNKLVDNLKKKQFILTDEGTLTRYLGVDVQHRNDGSFELKQPFLIQRIIDLLGLEGESNHNSKPTPATKPLLHKDENGEVRRNSWSYRRAIGMLTYLQGTTRPDISMAVHQCARFSQNPKLSHERAIKRIGRYLLGTKDRGIVFNPNKNLGLECFVDADYAGAWTKEDAGNADNVLSRTGYVIFYAKCPIVFVSKMQTEIALSTAESEYIACSTAMRDVISLMQLMKEIDGIFPLHMPKPRVHCDVYEDNESCIAMAKRRKFSPRTKHIAVKYHHFRRFVDKSIIIHSIDTKEQTADIMTKPVEVGLFQHLRIKLCGW